MSRCAVGCQNRNAFFFFTEYHRQRRPMKGNTDIYVCKPLNKQTGLMEPATITLLIKHEFGINNSSTYTTLCSS